MCCSGGVHTRTSECIVHVMGETGGYNGDIEFTAPWIADGVPPVKEGGREYVVGNGREMGGGGVCVGIYRGGEGQPGTIPDEVCLRDREGEGGGGGGGGTEAVSAATISNSVTALSAAFAPVAF